MTSGFCFSWLFLSKRTQDDNSYSLIVLAQALFRVRLHFRIPIFPIISIRSAWACSTLDYHSWSDGGSNRHSVFWQTISLVSMNRLTVLIGSTINGATVTVALNNWFATPTNNSSSDQKSRTGRHNRIRHARMMCAWQLWEWRIVWW